MPNDCWSDVLFHGNSETIKTLILTDLDNATLFSDDHVDTLAHFNARKVFHTKTIVKFKLWSPWTPPFTFLQALVQKFPDLWVRCIWEEEGGEGGSWICDKYSVKEMSWQGPCVEAYEFEPNTV